MSQSFYKSKKKTRLCGKTSGKCGEITYCLQLGTRVYALNCLFCSQICIQWDAFISHMEEEHNEELRSDHLLQEEIEEVNVEAKHFKKGTPKQSSETIFEELPQSSKMSAATECNDYSSDEEYDYTDPLEGNASVKCASVRAAFKTENDDFVADQSLDIRVIDAAKEDETCDSIDEQMDCNTQFTALESTRDDEQATKRDVMDKFDAIRRLMFRLLKEVKVAQNIRCENNNNIKKPSTLPSRPFENKDDFLNFEFHIEASEEQFSNLVTELRGYVPGNSKKFVKNCWRKLMRDDVAQGFCWQGTPVKMALKSLSTTLAIKLAFSEKFADHSEEVFEKCTIYFFQQAKNRYTKKLFKY